jgi:pimeloyl-ACP methyl ester carboxylesterase
MSLGAAVAIHLAARHPDRVRSLSVHSGWHATDAYLKTVLEQWRALATVHALLAQTDAVIAHDASGVLGRICARTLITFGARDLVCSTRFAEPLTSGIAGSEPVIFEHLSHAGLHEDPETFNRATLDFLLRQH